MPMGRPGCPELAFWTASTARNLIVLMQRSSCAVCPAPPVPLMTPSLLAMIVRWPYWGRPLVNSLHGGFSRMARPRPEDPRPPDAATSRVALFGNDADERQRLVRRGAELVLVAGRHVRVRAGLELIGLAVEVQLAAPGGDEVDVRPVVRVLRRMAAGVDVEEPHDPAVPALLGREEHSLHDALDAVAGHRHRGDVGRLSHHLAIGHASLLCIARSFLVRLYPLAPKATRHAAAARGWLQIGRDLLQRLSRDRRRGPLG